MGSSPMTSNIIEKGVYTYINYIIFIYIYLYVHQEIDMTLDIVSNPQRLSYFYTLNLWRKAEQYSMALPSLRMFQLKAAKPCWWSSFSRNLPGLCSSIFSNVIDYFSRRRNVYHSLSNEESWAKHRTKSLLWCVWSLGVWYLWSSCCLGAWELEMGWWNRRGLAGPIVTGTLKGKRGEKGWCRVSSSSWQKSSSRW